VGKLTWGLYAALNKNARSRPSLRSA